MVHTSRPVEKDRDRALGVILVAAAACLYGSGPYFAHIAYGAGMSPLPLLAWRYVFAAMVGWFLLATSHDGRRSLRMLTPRSLVTLVALGILFAGNAGSYTAALQTVPASLVAIIVYIYPALVAVISIRYARRLEGRRPWFALVLSMIGIVLAVGGIPEGADVPISGLALALSCAVIYAIWIVLAARLRGERPGDAPDAPEAPDAPKTAGAGPEDTSAAQTVPAALASSAIISTTTALAAFAFALLVGADPSPGVVPDPAWPALVGFGAFSGIAVVAFLRGTRRIGAARAALVSTIEPIYTIVLATLLLGEHLSPPQVLGGVLVVCGVLLAESGRPGRPAGDDTPATPELTTTGADRATV